MPRARPRGVPILPHSAPTVGGECGTSGKTDMAKDIMRIVTDERLVKGAHWAVFGIGLMSLTFSIVATAASAF